MSSKSVGEAVSSKSALPECQVRSVESECFIRVSSKSVGEEVSSKSALQECQVRSVE